MKTVHIKKEKHGKLHWYGIEVGGKLLTLGGQVMMYLAPSKYAASQMHADYVNNGNWKEGLLPK